MTVKYLSIDPGLSNGICGYNKRGHLQFSIIIKLDELVDFLKQYKRVDTVIVEDYTIYPNKAKDHIYSDVPTSRAIGRIESWAELNDTKLIKQPAHIKSTGYKFLGKKPLPKSNPNNHWLDAHAHFTFWAVGNGLIDPRSLLK